MGTGSRVAQLCLRIWQLICSVIVLGILSSFLHRVAQAGAHRDGRIIYGIITASISTAFSIVFIAPFLYSFLAWPADFVLFVMWLVLFCLEMTVSTHIPWRPGRCGTELTVYLADWRPHMQRGLVQQLLELLLGPVLAAAHPGVECQFWM